MDVGRVPDATRRGGIVRRAWLRHVLASLVVRRLRAEFPGTMGHFVFLAGLMRSSGR